jgi:hypothetical protein
MDRQRKQNLIAQLLQQWTVSYNTMKYARREICPAQYHSGKWNVVDCQEFMSKAKTILVEIQVMLLSIILTEWS